MVEYCRAPARCHRPARHTQRQWRDIQRETQEGGCTGDWQAFSHDVEVVPDFGDAADRVQVAGVEFECKEADGDIDDDCVQVGAGECGLETPHHRVNAHAQRDQPAHPTALP